MKAIASTLFVVAAALGANAAHADATRDQVRAELAQAKAQGSIYPDEQRLNQFTGTSSVSRAQVLAELAQAKAAGSIYPDEQYPEQVAATSGVDTRAQVRNELARAKAQGIEFDDATYPVPAHRVSLQQQRNASQRVASSNGNDSSVQ